MRSSRTALVLLLASGIAFAGDSVLPDWLPPGTTAVFGVSLRSLLDSPVLKSFQSDMQKMSADLMKGGPFPVLEMVQPGPLPGFDPLKDIDDLVIASTVEKDKATALIVLHGRFDPKRFPGTSTTYKGVLLFGDASQANGVIALLDESTAILGEGADVRAAIDRRGTASQVKPALAGQVRSMAGRFDFWGVGDLPVGFQPSGSQGDALNSIDHFEFGASIRQGLEFAGEIHARTPQDADKIAEAMKFIEAMLKAQPTPANGTKIDVQSANGTVKLSIAISEEDLKKGIEAQKRSFAAGMNSGIRFAGGLPVAGAPVPKPPVKAAPPKRGEIVKDDHGDTLKVTLPGGH